MADRVIKDLTSRALAAGDAIEMDDGVTAGGNRYEPSAAMVALLNAATTADARAALKEIAPHEGFFYRDNFFNGATGLMLVASSNSGGTGNTTISPTVGDGAIGVVNITSGAAAVATQRGGYGSNLTMFYPGGNGDVWYFGCRVYSNVRPDATATGHFVFGFSDVISSIGSGCSCIILRDDTANWEFITRNTGIESAYDTGLSGASGQPYRDLAFVLNADGGQMRCYVDGVLAATMTTNINTTTNRAGFKANCQRDAAVATTLSCYIDTIEIGCLYGTRRGAFDSIR